MKQRKIGLNFSVNKIMQAVLLAAGIGSRLSPLTNLLPKCMMPIGEYPLLGYWLSFLHDLGITRVLINTHHHAEIVVDFISQFNKKWIQTSYEPSLLGTAGTLRENFNFFDGSPTLVIHADNWCEANLKLFIDSHKMAKTHNCDITMMTFESDNPSECGIVTLDQEGIVTNFYEKLNNPPSNLANAAIYILDHSVIKYISSSKNILDISHDLIPLYINRIYTYSSNMPHRDIGNIKSLFLAQKYAKDISYQIGLSHQIQARIQKIKIELEHYELKNCR